MNLNQPMNAVSLAEVARREREQAEAQKAIESLFRTPGAEPMMLPTMETIQELERLEVPHRLSMRESGIGSRYVQITNEEIRWLTGVIENWRQLLAAARALHEIKQGSGLTAKEREWIERLAKSVAWRADAAGLIKALSLIDRQAAELRELRGMLIEYRTVYAEYEAWSDSDAEEAGEDDLCRGDRLMEKYTAIRDKLDAEAKRLAQEQPHDE